MMAYEAVMGWEVSTDEKQLLETITRVGKRGREMRRALQYHPQPDRKKLFQEPHQGTNNIDQGKD